MYRDEDGKIRFRPSSGQQPALDNASAAALIDGKGEIAQALLAAGAKAKFSGKLRAEGGTWGAITTDGDATFSVGGNQSQLYQPIQYGSSSEGNPLSGALPRNAIKDGQSALTLRPASAQRRDFTSTATSAAAAFPGGAGSPVKDYRGYADLIELRQRALPPVHESLSKYDDEITPFGAAQRLHKYICAQVNTAGLSRDAVVRTLATKPDVLASAILGPGASAETVLYQLSDMGPEAQTNQGPSKDPMILIARAADALTEHFESSPEIQQELAPPGAYAARALPGLDDSEEYDDKAVWLVANSCTISPEWQRVMRFLVQPHYRMPVKTPGMPSGVPVATGQVCNGNVQGCWSAKLWSATKNSFGPNNKSFLKDPAPQWNYTVAGRQALILFVHQTMQAIGSQSAMDNMIGAVAHRNRRKESEANRMVEGKPTTVSHDQYGQF